MFPRGFPFFGQAVNGLPSAPAAPPAESETLLAGKDGIPVQVVRHPRARRYLLRLQPDGTARLVIPRRGNRAEALRFLARSEAWLRERHRRWQLHAAPQTQPWRDGSVFLYRGEKTPLRIEENGAQARIHFADQEFTAPLRADYRPEVEAHLRRLAEKELPARTRELAREHAVAVNAITIRAQKTRWGSCSARGTISLNWRLVQAPVAVRDYLIVHELMHRREMNHSDRFWRHVAAAFPAYRAAEAWLKRTRLESF